jgi:hypothetical protein
MTNNEDDLKRKQSESEDDVEGHGLILDADYYITRKAGNTADLEREAREARRAKEARTNKPEQR